MGPLAIVLLERIHLLEGCFFRRFLPYEPELHCVPVPEICEGLGVAPETVCKLKKACYGLVEAPIEWFETVNTPPFHQLQTA